jgi:hypothetical protein
MKDWIKTKWETSKPLVIGIGVAIVAVLIIVVKKVFMKKSGSSTSAGVSTVKPK